MNQPINDDSHLWVSWDDYHGLIERLALVVHESGWKFDKILCLARGGLRVGDQLSRIYDLPLAILATSSYREAAGTQQGDLDIAQYITMTRGIHVGLHDRAAEAIVSNWGAISDRSGELIPEAGSVQGQVELEKLRLAADATQGSGGSV